MNGCSSLGSGKVRVKKVILIGMFFAMGGCTNPTVRKDVDRKIDISDYKTYKWVSQSEVKPLNLEYPNLDFMVGTVKVFRDPEIGAPLKREVDQDLSNKGFKLIESGSPDFYVTYYTMAHNKTWISTWNGVAPSIAYVPVIMYPDHSREATRKYRPGAVVIVIYDAGTRTPVWTETIQGALSGTELNQEKIAQDLRGESGFPARSSA